MKSNVYDIKTKQRISLDEPRNTVPGGIFMSTNDLVVSIVRNGARCYLVGALSEFANSLNVPTHDLMTLIFVFDRKSSKTFLVNHLKEKADQIFMGQLMYE